METPWRCEGFGGLKKQAQEPWLSPTCRMRLQLSGGSKWGWGVGLSKPWAKREFGRAQGGAITGTHKAWWRNVLEDRVLQKKKQKILKLDTLFASGARQVSSRGARCDGQDGQPLSELEQLRAASQALLGGVGSGAWKVGPFSHSLFLEQWNQLARPRGYFANSGSTIMVMNFNTVDGCLHHFETMVEAIVCWYLQRNHQSRVS